MKIKRMEKYIPCKQQKRYHGYVNIKQKKLEKSRNTEKGGYFIIRWSIYQEGIIITNIYQTTETQNIC